MGNISRYDKPADSNVQQTYSPIPWDQMMQAGQIMAKQHDQAADTLQKVYDDTYNLKYISGSADEQYIKQNVIPTTKEVFNKYISEDLGNPIILRQAMSEIRNKVDWNKVGQIQQSYTGWQQHNQDKRKLALDNQLDPDEQDYSKGYDTTLHGVYNKQSSAYTDPIMEFRQTYTIPLKDSTISESRDSLGNVRIKYGVDTNKLQDVVDSNIGNVKGSKLGDRLYRNYTRRYGINDGDLSEGQRDEILKKAMFEAGLPDTRDNIKYDRLAVPDVNSGRGNSSDQSESPLSQGPMISLAGNKSSDTPDIDELTGTKQKGWFSGLVSRAKEMWDMPRNLNSKEQKEFRNKVEKEGGIGGLGDITKLAYIIAGGKNNGVQESEKTDMYKEIERQAINKYGYKGNDPVRKTKLVENYVEDFYTRGRSIPTYELPSAKLAKENEDLFIKSNMASNREWFDPEKPLTKENKMQYSDVLEEYPQGKYQYSIIGAISNNNPMFPSGRQIGIYKVDEKGNPIALEKTLYMGSDLTETSANKFANDFHSVNYEVTGKKDYETYIPGLGVNGRVQIARKETPDGIKIEPEIQFEYKGQLRVFDGISKDNPTGTFDSTEEALKEFSKFVKTLR
jgi:hypothetical protein